MDLKYFKDQVIEQAIVKEVIDTDLKAGYIVPTKKRESFTKPTKKYLPFLNERNFETFTFHSGAP
jgi:hypothetical protein